MKFQTYLKAIAEKLLQSRVDGKQMTMEMVYQMLNEHQPSYGLTITEWTHLSDFIIKLRPANIIPEARKLAEEYGLEIST